LSSKILIRNWILMRANRPTDDRPPEGRDGVPPGAPGWVTRELIELTIRVWQPYYQVLLTAEDALAMIQSVGRLYGTLGRRSSP
jgi:hypothetical protein